MPTQLDQDRTREALAEFEAEHDRIVEAEARDLEDLVEENSLAAKRASPRLSSFRSAPARGYAASEPTSIGSVATPFAGCGTG